VTSELSPSGFPPPPKNPTTDVPELPPGAVRRSTAIDMSWPGNDAVDGTPAKLLLQARARDVVCDRDGHLHLVAEAGLTGWVDDADQLVRLDVSPDDERVHRLVGRSVRQGFRAAAAAAVADRRDEPLGQILDDIPVAVLISGFAWMVTQAAGRGRIDPVQRPDIPANPAQLKADICSGWRSDGTMMVGLRAKRGMPVPTTPPVPPSTHVHAPLAVLPLLSMPPGSMRRYRRIDVHPGDPFRVEAWFRDSHVLADGVDGGLHEYTVHGDFRGAGERCTVESMTATAHVLPHNECPAAAENVRDLTGLTAVGLRTSVLETLNGLRCCTHLNDLLRSLAAVPHLATDRH
jgi:Protein of unknown function (DUF2889)